jgi:hypothetical protein
MRLHPWVVLSLVAVLVTAASASRAEDAGPMEFVEVHRVGFAMTTIVAVSCEHFEDAFPDRAQVTVYAKKDIKRFSRLLSGLTPRCDDFPPDTRAKVLIYYKDGRVDTLCASYGRISLNGRAMNGDKRMVSFIESVRDPRAGGR